MKKVMAMMLTSIMLICSIAVMPASAAEPNIPNAVYYEDNLSIADYWSPDVKRVPESTEEGYFFGGWFQKSTDGDKTTYTALKEEYLKTVKLEELDNVCAKFVPSYLLSVKAQIEKEAQDSDGNIETTYLRLITGLDSNEYQKVNFDIYYNNRIHATSPDVTKLYSRIDNADGALEPKKTFGDAANYFAVVRLTKIWDDNFAKTIYARPYCITMDGTEVWGNAKYVRVEDGFKSKQYISVPINLQEGADMAAGSLTLSYDQTTLDVKDVTVGRLLQEMEYNVDAKNGVIRIVINGVADENSSYNNVTPDGLFANIRFQKKSDASQDLTHWSFGINGETFCNWEEQILVDENAVKAWDVRY